MRNLNKLKKNFDNDGFIVIKNFYLLQKLNNLKQVY